MKYSNHMWNQAFQNFICEILVYETSISYMKIKFIYEIFISRIELKLFTYEILFSYVKLHAKYLEGCMEKVPKRSTPKWSCQRFFISLLFWATTSEEHSLLLCPVRTKTSGNTFPYRLRTQLIRNQRCLFWRMWWCELFHGSLEL